MEIQSNQHDTDLRVQDGGITSRNALVVLWLNVAEESGVCAADEGDILGLEFLFDASFTDDEDFALVLREVEDAGDID